MSPPRRFASRRRTRGVSAVADRVEFQLTSLAGGARACFDLVVSNPPYVPERDRASLSPEVRDYEPADALFAGPDGLDVIRALVPAGAVALRPDGWLVMEIGYGQADAVAGLLRDAGFSDVELVPDLQGIPRVISGQVARRP